MSCNIDEKPKYINFTYVIPDKSVHQSVGKQHDKYNVSGSVRGLGPYAKVKGLQFQNLCRGRYTTKIRTTPPQMINGRPLTRPPVVCPSSSLYLTLVIDKRKEMIIKAHHKLQLVAGIPVRWARWACPLRLIHWQDGEDFWQTGAALSLHCKLFWLIDVSRALIKH